MKISINVEEYDNLNNDALMLRCLEYAGVDNWDGYDYAQEKFDLAIKERLNETSSIA